MAEKKFVKVYIKIYTAVAVKMKRSDHAIKLVDCHGYNFDYAYCKYPKPIILSNFIEIDETHLVSRTLQIILI